jgi:hypothetical protein
MLVLDEPQFLDVARDFQGQISAIASDEQWAFPPAGVWSLGLLDSTLDTTSVISTGTTTPTFIAPVGTLQIQELERAGVRYSLAIYPSNPQVGEFTFNPETRQVTVYTAAPVPDGAAFLIRTPPVSDAIPSNPLITNISALPTLFSRYELTGEVSWSCDWEGHPQAEFEFICTWSQLDGLIEELAPRSSRDTMPGTGFTLFGIGFEVEGLEVSKESPLVNPLREAKMKVSLKGKWEWYLDQAIILDAASDTATVGVRTIRGNTTISAIAQKVGAIVNAPTNQIYAPTEPRQEKTVALGDSFQEFLRHHGCFADYADAAGVAAVPLASVPVHTVMLSDLIDETLNIQISAHPRAVDYENSKLEWGSESKPTATAEDTQGKGAEQAPPRWRRLPPRREVVTTGSPTLAPPSDVSSAKNASSLIFDNGGPTREQITVWTEDGVTVRQFKHKKGFVAVACDHLYGKNGNVWVELGGNLVGFWQTIETLSTEYVYDGSTGYLVRVVTQGARVCRLKNESTNESLSAFDAWSKASAERKPLRLQALNAFRYTTIPVYEQQVYNLARLRDHYNDIPPQPTEEYQIEVPKSLSDGSLNPARFPGVAGVNTNAPEEFQKDGQTWIRVRQQVPVPGWTDPQYCSLQISRKVAFLGRPNPDSTDKKPLPDLVTGEDKEEERAIYVPNFRDRPKPVKGSALASGAWVEQETFVEHEKIATQIDAGLLRSARDTTQEQKKGRPGEHTRKEPKFEKIDPSTDADGDFPNKTEHEFRISTRPVRDRRLEGDAVNLPHATSLEQALVGAQTELLIENIKGTRTTSITVPWVVGLDIHAGDRINLEGHGLWVVLGYGKALEIVAPGVVQPKDVTLSLGWIPSLPEIVVERIPLPRESATVEGQKTVNGTPVTAQMNSGALVMGASRGSPTGA